MWDKLSWREVVIMSVLVFAVMLFIKVEVATYHVECENGSIEEIEPGTNYMVCGSNIVELNALTGFVQVNSGYVSGLNITGGKLQ